MRTLPATGMGGQSIIKRRTGRRGRKRSGNWRFHAEPCHLSGVMTAQAAPLSYAEFERVDIRVGRGVEVLDFPEARKPAYKLRIDFGPEIGVKKSSAQAT